MPTLGDFVDRCSIPMGTWSGNGAKLLVIDSPYDRDHPDLPYIPSANCGEFSPENWNGCQEGTSSHGTHVVGIAAARDNSFGVIGTAPGIQPGGLFVYPACNPSDIDCPGAATVDGIEWGIMKGVDVISMSLDGPYDQAIDNAIYQAIYYHDIVVVAGAGNDAGSTTRYPAGLLTTLAVSGYTESGEFAFEWSRCDEPPLGFPHSSNWGAHIDVAAPFEAWSTVNGGGYDNAPVWCGTSMATPHVSGTAAIMRAKNPAQTRTQIMDAIRDGATDAGDPGFDAFFGFGRLRSDVAINLVPAPPAPLSATINGPNHPAPGQRGCTWFAQVSGGSGSISYNWYRNGSPAGTSSAYTDNGSQC